MTNYRCIQLFWMLFGATMARHANAFSAPSPSPPQVAPYQALKSSPVTRASDSASVVLPNLWKDDEVAVCAFLRHFGCFLCWEHAASLKQKVLPAVPDQKVFFVGVGDTSEAAAQLAQQLEIDPAFCFADRGGAAGDALGLGKGFETMWNLPAPDVVQSMMTRNDGDTLSYVSQAYRAAAKNVELTPTKIEDTLRQGGIFVFKGNKLLYQHCDTGIGERFEVDDILAAVNAAA